MSRRKSITTKQIQAPHWDPNEVVIIRSLNTEDEEYIQDGLAAIEADGTPSIHAGRVKRLTIARAIVSWTFTDDQNRPLPLNEDSIKGLAGEDSQYILDQVNAMNKPLTEAEKKASSTPATTGTEAAAQ